MVSVGAEKRLWRARAEWTIDRIRPGMSAEEMDRARRKWPRGATNAARVLRTEKKGRPLCPLMGRFLRLIICGLGGVQKKGTDRWSTDKPFSTVDHLWIGDRVVSPLFLQAL